MIDMYPWQKRDNYKSLIRLFTRFHVWLFEKYDGKYLGDLEGFRFCLIKVKGRKSGLTRKIVLLTIPHEEAYLLVASQGGASTHPMWYLNMKANPEIEMQIGAQKISMVVSELSKKEKDLLWGKITSAYSGYQNYQDSTEREIPVLICRGS